jgi:hypothetical protein
MLKYDIIEVSKSLYSFGVRMAMKGDTGRFCVNFIPLNKVTINQPWPIPRPQDIFDRCAGSCWFTTLDLMRGFWQLPLHEDFIEMTGFSTRTGHYHFLKTPFGLRNAPTDFSLFMHSILGHFVFFAIERS